VATAVYSHRFFAQGGVSSVVSIGPVPDDEVWIVRDVDMFAGKQIEGAEIYLALQDVANFFAFNFGEEVQTWVQWNGRQVFEPGDYINIAVTVGNVDVMMSGYKLSAS
jgi:hypothetical protein